MLETTSWIACLIMAMMALYQYLKAEHALLHEHRLVSVSGDGLALHLEKAMLEVFEEIRSRAAEEKPPLPASGMAPDQFRFAVTVAFSAEDEGYIVSSAQIPGCSAWGPTIEYAVLEFGFALHLYVQTMLEDGETFQWP
ncbi:MAG: type II toxin-antitoxin system HicB family antitoxin [Deltaproteobacteria bacterium]|nr:type II toxin-antitoxin system HicB family antitoxin [Deltaproteobacteria bacterium]